MTQVPQCRKISVWCEVIRGENVILCVVCSTAWELSYYSVRHEVSGYHDMVEANVTLVFIYGEINTTGFLLASCVNKLSNSSSATDKSYCTAS